MIFDLRCEQKQSSLSLGRERKLAINGLYRFGGQDKGDDVKGLLGNKKKKEKQVGGG